MAWWTQKSDFLESTLCCPRVLSRRRRLFLGALAMLDYQRVSLVSRLTKSQDHVLWSLLWHDMTSTVLCMSELTIYALNSYEANTPIYHCHCFSLLLILDAISVQDRVLLVCIPSTSLYWTLAGLDGITVTVRSRVTIRVKCGILLGWSGGNLRRT